MPLWSDVAFEEEDEVVDEWGQLARAEIKSLFGLDKEDEDVVSIEVHRGERWTLEAGRLNDVFNVSDSSRLIVMDLGF
jgi:hypothetical protein